MSETYIRIYRRTAAGDIFDHKHDMELSDFGGVVPAAGDLILDPGVLQGSTRSDPHNRRMWTVVQRVFNPRDLGGEYIVLVIEDRSVSEHEVELLPT